MLSIYVNNYPETKLFTGKGLSHWRQPPANELNRDSSCGDVIGGDHAEPAHLGRSHAHAQA